MMVCSLVQGKFTDYLDGRLNGVEMQDISAHLGDCDACTREWEELRSTQGMLAALGPAPEPQDLLLRIRVAVSQERARASRSIREVWNLAWKNTIGPFLLQASAGFASAVLLLGTVTVLVTMFTQPQPVRANEDEPLGIASAPHLMYLSSGVGDEITTSANPVVVEVYINDEGQVYDYRIVSGPSDAATRAQVENLLLLSRFQPARFFGQPVRGLAVLSFSGISVRG
ncbi:MAG TPA: zf-HC2 domain-containing protein [Terracidiphilus sp.]|nr:zf-HC2 domain-containing protein [Terracidiphilus sp.]